MFSFQKPINNPDIRAITSKTTNKKKRNLATVAAPAAILVNPKSAATIAITRKIRAHFNMSCSLEFIP